ncbi:hypothetical protein F9B85_10170 [Heliorestis acidaminivorans]|uniref:DUF4878 domain-containing protein n=1 Tax=Heliorestis acidaminivorans TaxID=553427 RepID=A0A6I0EW19_9FIRM|nr:hypothetical protein [Heliorestis acidaminivorans]KAB2952168.1 hypothetical protein F9B85_10170 [Heliorestis acidaminivorans]
MNIKKSLIFIMVLMLTMSGCTGSSTAKKTVVEDFFDLIIQGNYYEAEKLLVNDDDFETLGQVNEDIQKKEITKLYFSKFSYEIKKVDKSLLLVEITAIDETKLLEKILDDITLAGFSGNILTGFQDATKDTFKRITDGIKNDSVPIQRKTIVVSLKEVDGNYRIDLDEDFKRGFFEPILKVLDINEMLMR